MQRGARAASAVSVEDLLLRIEAGLEAGVDPDTAWFRTLVCDLLPQMLRLAGAMTATEAPIDPASALPRARSADLRFAWDAVASRLNHWLDARGLIEQDPRIRREELALLMRQVALWLRARAVHLGQGAL